MLYSYLQAPVVFNKCLFSMTLFCLVKSKSVCCFEENIGLSQVLWLFAGEWVKAESKASGAASDAAAAVQQHAAVGLQPQHHAHSVTTCHPGRLPPTFSLLCVYTRLMKLLSFRWSVKLLQVTSHWGYYTLTSGLFV